MRTRLRSLSWVWWTLPLVAKGPLSPSYPVLWGLRGPASYAPDSSRWHSPCSRTDCRVLVDSRCPRWCRAGVPTTRWSVSCSWGRSTPSSSSGTSRRRTSDVLPRPRWTDRETTPAASGSASLATTWQQHVEVLVVTIRIRLLFDGRSTVYQRSFRSQWQSYSEDVPALWHWSSRTVNTYNNVRINSIRNTVHVIIHCA